MPEVALKPRPKAIEVAPDDVELIDPDGKTDAEREAEARFEALNPCGVCGMSQHEGPEGTSWHGGDHTAALSCWKCGYRPGQAVPAGIAMGGPAIDEARVTRLMGELKEGVANEIIEQLRTAGVLPKDAVPAGEDPETLRAQIRAEIEAELAAQHEAPPGDPARQEVPVT